MIDHSPCQNEHFINSSIENLSCSVLFHIKTRVTHRYFVTNCSLPQFFKIFVSLPLLSVTSRFKIFQIVLLTLMQPPPVLIQLTIPPWFKQISKGNFISSTVAFYQKSTFNLLNPFVKSLSEFMGYFQVNFQTTTNDFFS